MGENAPGRGRLQLITRGARVRCPSPLRVLPPDGGDSFTSMEAHSGGLHHYHRSQRRRDRSADHHSRGYGFRQCPYHRIDRARGRRCRAVTAAIARGESRTAHRSTRSIGSRGDCREATSRTSGGVRRRGGAGGSGRTSGGTGTIGVARPCRQIGSGEEGRPQGAREESTIAGSPGRCRKGGRAVHGSSGLSADAGSRRGACGVPRGRGYDGAGAAFRGAEAHRDRLATASA